MLGSRGGLEIDDNTRELEKWSLALVDSLGMPFPRRIVGCPEVSVGSTSFPLLLTRNESRMSATTSQPSMLRTWMEGLASTKGSNP